MRQEIYAKKKKWDGGHFDNRPLVMVFMNNEHNYLAVL
jgi:hypothetical protein